MEIGRDWDAEWKNQWPGEKDAPEFKATMLDFYQVSRAPRWRGAQLALSGVCVEMPQSPCTYHALHRNRP
jgi:hypothetical protein